LQIGEISLMKEMTSVAKTMMTDEEKAELEKEMNDNVNGGPASPSPAVAAESSASSLHAPTAEPSTAEAHNGALTPSPLPSPSGDSGEDKTLQAKSTREKKDKRSKISPEQKQKLHELEVERKKNMEERVEQLHKKLIDRLRPFVEAANPGAAGDPETKAFEERMHREADDLKLESFGVEVRPSFATDMCVQQRGGLHICLYVSSCTPSAVSTS
jgi:hypothetical protein